MAVDAIRSAMTRAEKSRTEVSRQVDRAYGCDCVSSGTPKTSIPLFDPDLASRQAGRCPIDITEDLLAEWSPECVLDVGPSDFLSHLYEPEERVFVTDNQKSKDGWIWNHGEDLGEFTTASSALTWGGSPHCNS